ncbi:hypothetical protein [Mycobacteroides abscessus]|uniref:hypothetical protein n=1 Tax=Mycobacteroides abscessus TaxID=36809 RepID=UPI000C26BB6B|nr:hypothetical protein [Mycobacteroides abscessus]PVB24449.1 hypothetical protein DDJ71_06270 [Mycobacteroides abscessus]
MNDIVFMDTETLGLDIDAPIWEFAAIRRAPEGTETQLHIQIHHHPDSWLTGPDALPEQFAADYRDRFDAGHAWVPSGAARAIASFLSGGPHIVGAVPSFDTARISHQLLRPALIPDPWHYHLIDIENVVMGYLHGVAARAIDEARMRGEEPHPALVNRPGPPYKSDDLSRAVNVDPNDFDRHTAMGDVLWTRAQWDAVMLPNSVAPALGAGQ